ncbi:MAG TPA: CHRD domain-containing protein [Bryobacteraceae bacterium]|jgi:hypothetical protein|nr:CHRD domain-containing protein [Bryobacteraceae bacterium]
MRLKSILVAAILILAPQLSATIITYEGTLSGSNENPPTGSSGTGLAVVTTDDVSNTIHLVITFSGLTSGDTGAHIHCCVAQGGNTGVATTLPVFTGFPTGVTSGSYNQTLSLIDPTFYNPSFITAHGGTVAAAEAVLLAGMAADQSYFNIHTSISPGGEIRAFLVPVPEPATWGFVGLALTGLALLGRKHRLSA